MTTRLRTSRRRSSPRSAPRRRKLPAEESADPGAPPPVDGPRVTPNPGDDEPPPPADPAKLAFPLPYTTELGMIRVAPAPDDRLWVSRSRGTTTRSLPCSMLTGAPGRLALVVGIADRLPAPRCARRRRAAALLLQRSDPSAPTAAAASSGCSRSRRVDNRWQASRSPSRPGLLPGLTFEAHGWSGTSVVLTEYDGSDDEVREFRMSAGSWSSGPTATSCLAPGSRRR